MQVILSSPTTIFHINNMQENFYLLSPLSHIAHITNIQNDFSTPTLLSHIETIKASRYGENLSPLALLCYAENNTIISHRECKTI